MLFALWKNSLNLVTGVYRIRNNELTSQHTFQNLCRGIDTALEKVISYVLSHTIDDNPVFLIASFGLDGADAALTFRHWQLIGKAQIFEPRYAEGTIINGKNRSGQKIKLKKIGKVKKAFMKANPENWHYHGGSQRSANGIKLNSFVSSKAVQRASTTLGRVTTVATGAMAAWGQYQEDSLNPSMGEGEKIARATTQGVVQGAAAWGGAFAGAKLGAAIGTFGGPIGIAVGGIVGGVVGGIVGQMAGEAIADRANAGLSSAIHSN